MEKVYPLIHNIYERQARLTINQEKNNKKKKKKKKKNDHSFLPKRPSFFYFSGAGKFCLAHGLRKLTRDIRSDVRTLNFRSDVTYLTQQKSLNDVRRSRHAMENVKNKRNDE